MFQYHIVLCSIPVSQCFVFQYHIVLCSMFQSSNQCPNVLVLQSLSVQVQCEARDCGVDGPVQDSVSGGILVISQGALHHKRELNH